MARLDVGLCRLAATLMPGGRLEAVEPLSPDDVVALIINYPFFALDRPGAWSGLGALWRRAWARYLRASGDGGLLSAVAPFLAWWVLVLACPRFYPGLSPGGRNALLGLAERALDAPAERDAFYETLARLLPGLGVTYESPESPEEMASGGLDDEAIEAVVAAVKRCGIGQGEAPVQPFGARRNRSTTAPVRPATRARPRAHSRTALICSS